MDKKEVAVELGNVAREGQTVLRMLRATHDVWRLGLMSEDLLEEL